MIRLLLISLLVACATPTPKRNLAAAFVHSVEPDATCEPYFTDAGATHAHSATCRIPATKAVVYCVIAADKGPACQSLNGDAPPPPRAPTAPPPTGPGVPPPDAPPPAASSPPAVTTPIKAPGKRPPAMK